MSLRRWSPIHYHSYVATVKCATSTDAVALINVCIDLLTLAAGDLSTLGRKIRQPTSEAGHLIFRNSSTINNDKTPDKVPLYAYFHCQNTPNSTPKLGTTIKWRSKLRRVVRESRNTYIHASTESLWRWLTILSLPAYIKPFKLG